MAPSYKDTVILPQTSFAMRANLNQREPDLLAHWDQTNLYAELQKANEGKPIFTLHDGPPFANGHIHLGTALNKILKDIVNRFQMMAGHAVYFRPGWDCHGLPIEWKVEEEYRKAKKDKDQISISEFRKECAAFAQKWIDVQRSEFKRLGVLGDWDNPYTTMDKSSEAKIIEELNKFILNGSLYRGARPVFWSVVEKTALAEAEVEYEDHTSTTVYAAFPIKSSPLDLENTSVVIWTTTPWTLPANQALGFGETIEYAHIALPSGAKYLVAKDRLTTFEEDTGQKPKVLATYNGSELHGTICYHPFYNHGYSDDRPLLAGDFVTTEQGTGFVHLAPDHGEDDFVLCKKHGFAPLEFVGDDGVYKSTLPLFGGQHIFKAHTSILEHLEKCGALLAHGKLVHSYPHSWRSKAPLIYRAVPQWFIDLDTNGLRTKALKAIEDVTWYPAKSKSRIKSMVESRPDWCISRQRAWGVPLTIFTHKESGEPLRDPVIQQRIVDVIREKGADAWFEPSITRLLAPTYNPNDYVPSMDIIDVWFESGSTHTFALEDDPKSNWPADLYLEGSDQHRGWFQSSLLESCGTRGTAPYKAVMTHGFIVDDKGRKMSKSLGNVVSIHDLMEKHGIEILRLWIACADFSQDLRIGSEILERTTDTYRRLRNTLRFILGNLSHYDASKQVAYHDLPDLEKWVLHRLSELSQKVSELQNTHAYQDVITDIHHFCSVDLSSFYFDIRKDALYCDGLNSSLRLSVVTVLDHLFTALTTWLAPVLCFTTEDAWLARHGTGSIHLQSFPSLDSTWHNPALGEKWKKIRELRTVITAALEKAREAKTVGSSLGAHATLSADPTHLNYLSGLDMAELCITSAFTVVPGTTEPSVSIEAASGHKCERCWKILPEVGTKSTYETLCNRCADVIASGDYQ